MASAATQHQPSHPTSFGTQGDHYNPTSTLVIPAAQEQAYQPRNVATTLNYFKENEDGSPPPPNYAGSAQSFDRPTFQQKVVVGDIRGSEDKYTLDGKGFQIVNHVSAEKDFRDEEKIKDVYYKETEDLLKNTTGASKIFIFDHTIRRPSPTADGLRGPVQRVHIDQSYAAAPKRVSYHLPAEATELLKGRYQIINVWRPIKTILKDPLGVAEADSVGEEELVPIRLIYPHREGETLAVRAKEGHRWRYLSGQTPGEVLLIKCFDSKTDGRARRVPHTSFVDVEREGEEARESIEVRALVFHPDDLE